jgi:hypothetical protein
MKSAGKNPGANFKFRVLRSTGREIGHRKKHDHRERSDQRHITHVMAGDSCTRLISTPYDRVIRHSLVLRRRQIRHRRTTQATDGRSAAASGANVKHAQSLPDQRHAVKTIFLGIFTNIHSGGGRWNFYRKSNSFKGKKGRGVTEKRTKNSGVMIVAFAAVAAWQIYDMATTAETPSRALAILQYVLLAGLLIGLVGSLLNFLRSQ